MRLQSNNYDISLLCSGSKGFGKSTTAIHFAREYVKTFGFVCPKCGCEFYKNIYTVKTDSSGEKYFEVPEYVLKDKAWIQCPTYERMDFKSNSKVVYLGCGHKFKYSERKRIKWEASKFIAYDAKGLTDLLFHAVPFSPIIADEAFQILGGQNHNRAENKYLKEVLNNARPKRHIMFYCIPEVTWLDSKLREGFSSFWIRMIERGEAVIFEKDKGEAKDKYHMKELEKIFGTVKFFTPMDKIKRNLRKHPCFFDMIKIPELPEKIYADYELYRNSVLLQRQVEELELSNKDIAKIMAWNIMRNWDRLKIDVDKSKELRPTYDIMSRDVVVDPVSRKSLASEPTLRNWLKGVDDYVASKGSTFEVFEGVLEDAEQPKKKKPATEEIDDDEVISL